MLIPLPNSVAKPPSPWASDPKPKSTVQYQFWDPVYILGCTVRHLGKVLELGGIGVERRGCEPVRVNVNSWVFHDFGTSGSAYLPEKRDNVRWVRGQDSIKTSKSIFHTPGRHLVDTYTIKGRST